MLAAAVAKGYMNFNSIKVRLKPYPIHQPSRIALFQFHKGTIKTLTCGYR